MEVSCRIILIEKKNQFLTNLQSIEKEWKKL